MDFKRALELFVPDVLCETTSRYELSQNENPCLPQKILLIHSVQLNCRIDPHFLKPDLRGGWMAMVKHFRYSLIMKNPSCLCVLLRRKSSTGYVNLHASCPRVRIHAFTRRSSSFDEVTIDPHFLKPDLRWWVDGNGKSLAPFEISASGSFPTSRSLQPRLWLS
ncbi:hypothetical protein AVEN_146260-1 [Araneus ventricosus]|uniref:Uncharacterized protein n=1 Tax=Araneus ventricosus TaxID=182803 RepID=A0A4Y2GDD3_ARAVE|nr:hypothetical protein AVEN_146260-1 [Araneus ventricosus]